MNFTPEDDRVVLAVFSTLLLIAPIGVVFAMGAQAAFRRGGLPSLLACWIVGTGCVAMLMIWRIHQQQALFGFTATQMAAQSLWQWCLPMWALAFAFVCIRIWRRRASTHASVVWSAVASLPSYFAGFLLFLAIVAAIDASAWFK